MRALLVACLPLLLVAFSLAPIATADDEDTTGAPTWSAPQGVPASPTAQATPSQLPPPRVVYVSRQPPAALAYEAPANIAEPLPTPPAPAPEAPAPAIEENAEEPEAAKPFVMPTTSKVISVGKNHNQPWHGNWKALELDMLLAVVGQSGQHIGATVTFYETLNGQPLRAAMQPYVDGEGNVCVYTKLALIRSGSRLLRSRLLIPYRAFPWPTKGPAYGVEAHVRLMRRDAAGNFSVLARGETSFTLHFERAENCGTTADRSKPCGTPMARALAYDWEMLLSEETGTTLSEARVPPPKGLGSFRPWYELRWRTRGGTVDKKETQWAR